MPNNSTASKARGLAIEGIEGQSAHPLGSRKHHQVREAGTSCPVAEGGLGDIVGGFDDEALGSHEFSQDRCDTVSGIAVGPLEDPDEIDDNLSAGVGRLFGRNRLQQSPGCFRLLPVVATR